MIVSEIETIRDERPYIKSAIEKGDMFEISRKNQKTGEMYFVWIDKNLYIEFIRAQRCPIKLQNKLSQEHIDFMVKNIIPGEKTNHL